MTGRAPHPPRRVPRWQERMDAAGTPQERLAAAYSRLTAALAHMSRAKRPDAAAQVRDTALALDVAGRAADALMALSARLEGDSR
jgi:hypothetical protein